MLDLRRLSLLSVLVLVLAGLGIVTASAPAVAAPCDAPILSPVACENTLPGNPESEWGVTGAGSTSIQGFATQISVDQGETVGFKVDTAASSYRLDIYRMGYYGGNGARRVATVLPTVLNNQPTCITGIGTGLVDCGNWTQNASWAVPGTAVSGIYFARLVRTDGPTGASHVVFVVRDDDGGSDLLFQTSDTTWQAYNAYGGNSLYTGQPAGRAYKVSYNRPFTTRGNAPEDWVFNAEYPMVRFLESNGYDVSYSTGIDTDRRGAELLEHEAFLSVGHDEYWSGTQRTNVEAARAAGVDLAFFSGNEVFWKTRWENSIDGSGTPYRTLVTYKETHANAKIDPLPNVWTGTWRDPRFSPPGDGNRPENALTGQIFTINCCAINMVVGQADGRMRFWRNTRVATLGTNATTTIGSNVIGYEWDEDLDNGSRSPGAFRVSQTAGSGDRITDYGTNYAQGAATHSMTMYRHASGALVFGAGTIQWAWALDNQHDRGSAAADVAAQQATVNLFADMGVQSTTLRPGLVAATASTDGTAPTSAITSPAAGAILPTGTPVTVTGTAADVGGRVGGVEVSSDNGATWRRATGRDTWTYTFTPTTSGTITLRSRATDDSANIGTPSTGTPVTVGSVPATCPCTIWPSTATPAATDPDTNPVELGVKFRSSSAGFITGIRYYKPSASSGTHVGSLWSSTGTRLANVTFTNETASGWQQASFATPVAVNANTTYVASYFSPARYSVSGAYFASAPTSRGPLTALQNGTDGGNGVYRYTSTAGVFPNSTYNSENYWVDVVFTESVTDTTKPTLASRTPAPGATGVVVGANTTAVFSEAVQQATIGFGLRDPGGALVPAATAYDAATRTATLDPNAALAPGTVYTATVSGARDTAGNQMDPVSWSFTTEAPDTTKPTLASRTPAPGATGVVVGANTTAVFSEAVQQATIGFELRDPGGALVPAATAYDAATRTATLDPNAALAPGTVYTATVSGARDTAGNQMDPVSWSFTTEAPDTTPPTLTNRTPTPGATGVGTGSTVTAVFSEALQTGTLAFELRTPGGTLVPSTTVYDGATRTATLTPNAALTLSTTYTASISGARDTAGNQMTPLSWSFTTTASTFNCPCTVWSSTATPAGTDPDTSSVELGVKFRASVNGFVTGIRYYKPSTSTGTHVGSLWSATGTRLGAVTFTNESASGWQQATFASPIPVTAGTTYIASYFTPSRYAVNSAYFASAATTRGPLTALQNGTDGGNGVYRYTSTAGAFPNSSYNAENYWVDPVFAESAQDNLPPTVIGRSPAVGATGVPVGIRPSVSFSEPVTGSSVVMELRNAANQVVAGATAYDPATVTATFTPQSDLAYSSTYTVNISGASDPSGNTVAPVSWTFQTSAPPPPGIDDGTGGPIAVVTSSGNPSSSYLAEILRAEGLNEFANLRVPSLTAASLTSYAMVVLGDVLLSDTQVAALTAWVESGGNLVAMRPDARLYSLAGISAQSGTVVDGYVGLNPASEPAAGITTETMQFHGTASRYALAGASSVAGLYSTATASTGLPAVTLRSVGTNGGQVATFAFDLARSVIATRQGNIAWAGQDRDGLSPNRSNDLFFGGSSTDWVNLAKVHVPQADEQQRLLANLLTVMARDRLPLPRFWYLPGTHKAAIVATGDDHGTGGTSGRFSTYAAASPPGCSVALWECPRFTSYVYPSTPLSNSQASSFHSQGFEIGLHPQNGCSNFASESDLLSTYATQLSTWRAKYTSLPSPTTSRFHCIVWSDWVSQPKAELASGIRLDTNYYYYPGSWVADRPGFMNGSGMPMRFTDTDGSMIDVYQANTSMTDESEQSFPFTPDALLDRALGPLGYYGAFTANLHTDSATTFEDNQVLASAQERDVPVITARQLLTWTDGRNGSSFGNLTWDGSGLGFTIGVGAGATNLTAMLPTTGPNGTTLSSVTRGSASVAVTMMTVKGQQYAVFAAIGGTYRASYSVGGAAAVSKATAHDVTSDAATVTWRTSRPATTVVELGTSPDDLSTEVVVAERTEEHRADLSNLRPATRYHFRVRSRGPDGTWRLWPSADLPPATFTTSSRDLGAPVISGVRTVALPDGTARVSWRTSEPATSLVRFGRVGAARMRVRLDRKLTRQHTVVLTGLATHRLYTMRLGSRDAAGNAAAVRVASLRTGAAGLAMQTAEELRTGRTSGTAAVTGFGLGSLTVRGTGTGRYLSRVLDSGLKVAWRRLVLDADVPLGTRLVISVRTGSTAVPDGTWSSWQAADTETPLRLAGRFLQYAVDLAATHSTRPRLRAIGFTHSGRPRSDGEH